MSLWALGECSIFSFCLQLDAQAFVPLCFTFLKDPSPAFRLCNLRVARRGEGGSGLNLCGSFACEISCQHSPGPAALIQRGSDSSKAVAR